MNPRTQRVCVWCGPAMIVLWVVGVWVFAGFVPPPAPTMDKQAVADLFREHANPIRFGLLLTCIGSALLGPFVGVISVHLKRIEGPQSPLAYAQLALGAALPLEFIFPVVLLQVATYRPERSPEAIQTLYDVGWILFISVVTTAVVQMLVIGAAILGDRRESPVFPRWSGYFTIWVGLMLTPGSVCVFFKTGPLAWNGLFTWWMPLTVFAVWFGVITALMLKAITAQVGDGSRDDEPAGYATREEVQRRFAELTAQLAELRSTERSPRH